MFLAIISLHIAALRTRSSIRNVNALTGRGFPALRQGHLTPRGGILGLAFAYQDLRFSGDMAIHREGLPDDVLRVVCDDRRRAVLGELDTAADPDFDRLTGLAASLMQAAVALVTFVDREHQCFKSAIGIQKREMPVGLSFCAHAIVAGDDVMVVEDAIADPRFAGDPLVGKHHLRFYAGAPIVVAGARLGTICVLDRVARPRPSPELLAQLKSLAALAATLFTLKDGERAGALARAALVREEKRRAIAVEAGGLASWVWDVRSGIIECDAALPVQFDLPPTTRLTARELFIRIDRRDANLSRAGFRQSLSTSDDYSGEYRVKTAKPTRWLASRSRVVERDAQGLPVMVFGVNYDISERKFTEERQRHLLRELNHRVRNTLATVQALASQTVRHARNPDEFLEAFSARLQALGLAHGLLSDHEWRGIGISELVRREVKPFDDSDSRRILISGDDVLLSPDQALGLGLILHELGSNAVKYGSLSTPAGKVQVAWRVDGWRTKRRLVLDWKETGGPAVVPPDRHGFGSILIRRSLAKVLSSEVRHDFAPDGVTAEISIPLDEPTE
jgi:two-component sensor histidine kinase